MELDPDSREMIEVLEGWRALPTADTDPIAYRAGSLAIPLPPSSVVIEHVEDVTAPGPAGPLAMRLYRDRPAAGAMPFLLFLHGGGFVVGNIGTHDDMCRRLAKTTGWLIGSLDYRLSPETRFPGALEDAHAALVWAAGPDGAEHGIDPKRIVSIGDSAGGNLAAGVALLAKRRGGPALAGQVLLYPCLDSRHEGASHTENATGYFLTAEASRWYWEQYATPGAGRDDPLMSPVRATDLAGLPPALILTAGFDPLRDDGAAYADKLKLSGVAVDYACLEGTFHGFLTFAHLSAAAKGTELVRDYLARL